MSTTIAPKKTLYVDYPVPPSQIVSVRVVASEAVNVYAMDEQTLKTFLEQRKAPPMAFDVSEVGTRHERSIRLPLIPRWYLVIQNPWEKSVETEYTVVALAPVLAGGIGVAGATGVGPNSTSTAVTMFGGGIFPSRS